MALDTIKGMINTYKPQNAFSFEICPRDQQTGKPIRDAKSPVEIYMTVGPIQYTENFKFRISYEPTFNNGTSVVDMGTGNSQIKLDGEFHIYHYDIPPSGPPLQVNLGGGFAEFGINTALNAYESFKTKVIDKYKRMAGVSVRSGVEEFFDFMGIFYFSQIDKKIFKPKSGTQADKVLKILGNSSKFNYSEFCLIYHDYDRNRHVEVILPQDGFQISRSAKDTNTYTYSINLVVIRDLEKELQALAPKTGTSPFFTLNQAITDLQNLINFPLKITGLLVNIADFVKQITGSGQVLVDTFNNMKTRFNADGKLISSTFQSAVDDVNRGLGRKKNATYTERVDQVLDEYSDLLYEASTDESKFGSLTANAIAATQSLIYIVGNILNPPNNTGDPAQESLLPNADSTNMISNEVYQWLIVFEDTLTTIQSTYTQASIDDSYGIYYGSGSDTFQSIATNILGDSSLAGALAAYNNMDVNAIISGQAVKLPFGEKTNMFYKLPDPYRIQDLENGLLGFDLALTPDRDFQIAPNGDLGVTEGLTTLTENIVDILDIPIGSWVADPFIGNPILIGEVQEEQDKQNSLGRLLQQIQSDVRIESAEILEASQDGGAISFLMRITPKAGRQFILRV